MGNESELTLVMKAKDLASKSVLGLQGSLRGLHGVAGKAGGGLKTLGGGIAHVAKQGALLAAGALTAIVGALGLATKAAAEEETGIVRMNQALKANVKGFTGNTAAIEATIAQREKLAFSDDSLRASLTLLVAKTHDVGKAMALQAIAMDLARLKGIPLEDASKKLSMALSGNKKILKELGIELPKTATQTQILAAIQKAAAGQAAAYGATSQGAMEAFKIAAGDLVEDIGGAFLPIMTGLFKFLTDTGIPAIRGVMKAIGDWFAANQPLISQITGFVSGVLSAIVSFITGTVVPTIAAVVGAVGSWIAANQPLIQGIQGFVSGVLDTFVLGIKTIVDIFTSFGPLAPIIAGVTAAVIALGVAASINPLILILGAIVLAVGILAKAWNENWGGIRQVFASVAQFIGAALDNLRKGFDAFLGFFRSIWDGIVGIAKGGANFMIGIINGIISAIDGIQVHIPRIGLDTPAGFIGVGPFDWNGLQIPKIPYLAEGGIARRPTLAMIGERGDEAVVPLDSPQARGMLGGPSGSPVVIVLQLDGREISRFVDRRLYLSLARSGTSTRPR